jgi:acyl-coenzyme A thioesterase PaaI-like protein
MNDRSSSDLAELVRRTFDAQGFMRLVGAKVELVERGKVTLGVDRRDELLQQHGFFHGGVVALLIDKATGAAAATVQRGEGQGPPNTRSISSRRASAIGSPAQRRSSSPAGA